MVRIKICGITSLDDACAAVDAGAHAIGFVFFDQSPRSVSPQKAAAIIAKLPPFIQTVGLFVDEDPDRVNWTADFCGLDLVQLHGTETPDYCCGIRRRVIKAFRIRSHESLASLRSYSAAGYLLDAWSDTSPGGTGTSFDWQLAAGDLPREKIILAGGLTPANVVSAIRAVRPYAVDVSSGVETAPGKKCHDLIRQFVSAVLSAGHL